jgi:hypothetical protein
MSNAQHTPGPWMGMDESGKYNGDHSWSAEDEDACVSEFAPIYAGKKVIALVVHSSANFYAGASPKLDANARLIAAAPELLAALEGFVAAQCAKRDAYSNNDIAHAIGLLVKAEEKAVAAIAKAKGQ